MAQLKRPNVLLVVTDQQRADLLGAAGRVPVLTPAADRLCEQGTMFTRAYVATPLCTPSRTTLLSGQYPSRHGVWTNGLMTPESTLSLPRLLSERGGYATAIIGKSHFQPTHERPELELGIEAPPRSRDHEFFRRWRGPYYGFQEAVVCVGHTFLHTAYSMHYGLHLHDHGIPRAAPYFMTYPEAEQAIGTHGAAGLPATRPPDLRPSTWALPEELHSSTWVGSQAVDYLRRHASSSEPFYLCVNFPDPHPPFAVPAPWDRMYEDAELPPPARRLGEWESKPELYRATIERRVEEERWHERFGPAHQLALVTPSDGRSELEERWWRTYMGMQSLVDKNLGRILDELDACGLAETTLVVVTSDHGDSMGDHFLWHKGGCHYDGTIRVPFVVRWPGRVPAAERSESLQSLVDVAGTVMSAAGLEPHPAMQGVDQLAAWTDPTARPRSGVMIENRLEHGLDVTSWVTERHRLSVHSDLKRGRTELELYDLRDDPEELGSLADEGLAAGLLGELVRETVAARSPLQERLTAA